MVYRDDPQQLAVDQGEEEEAAVSGEEEGFAPLYIGEEDTEEEQNSALRRRTRRRRILSCGQPLGLCFGTLLISLIVGVWIHHGGPKNEPAPNSPPSLEQEGHISKTKENPKKKPLPPKNIDKNQADDPGLPSPPVIDGFCDANFDYTSLIEKISKHPTQRCDGGEHNIQTSNAPCRCNDPMIGSKTQKSWIKAWDKTFKRNKILLRSYKNGGLDVLLLGDSITEHWLGTDQANLLHGKINPKYKEIHHIYQQLFQSSPSTQLTGLALGIGGDRCSQLLYRVQNGELPPNMPVPIVWVNIGTNDLPDHCSENAIVAGIVSVVREIASRPLVQRVVINSILPRGGTPAERFHVDLDKAWQIARRVNSRVECFAQNEPKAEFFNGTQLFLSQENPEYRNETLYMDDVHPSALGYQVWGEAIVQRIQTIQQELPPLVVPTAAPTVAAPTSPPVVVPPLDPFSTTCPALDFNYTPTFPDMSSRCDRVSHVPCFCRDPYEPVERNFNGQQTVGDWGHAYQRNKISLELYLPAGYPVGPFKKPNPPHPNVRPLDVLLMGDSITENWLGTKYAIATVTTNGVNTLRSIYKIYLDLFRRAKTAKVEGLALGVAGDRSPNVLFRMQHEELPDVLSVPVVFLMIGTNDVGLDNCNVDSTTAGIVRAAQEIESRTLVQRVVLSSLLPRGGDPRYWEIHRRVNHNLACYAESRGPEVEFFNATDLFWSQDGSGLNRSLFMDEVHPSPTGYRLWGQAIVEKVIEIKKELGLLEASNDDDGTGGDFSRTPSTTTTQSWCHAHPLLTTDPKAFVDGVSFQRAQRCPDASSANKNNACKCRDPQVPVRDRWKQMKAWDRTTKRNMNLVNKAVQNNETVDVLLLGDSITEHWQGTDLGMARPSWAPCQEVYQDLFRQQQPSSPDTVSGVALGIGGDRCPHLLYRLQNGEFPKALQVPVVWITIGTNDYSDSCNEDAIVAGNIVIVEEILRQKPLTRVVINSLLPRREVTKFLHNVNDGLRCFAERSRDSVEFFNATGLFLKTSSGEIDESLYMDAVHPNEKGYRVWGDAIVQRVQEIKEELGIID